MNTKTKEINKRLKSYDAKRTDRALQNSVNRQNRLKDLITNHGFEHVALAAGFTENTLRQYVRVAIPPSISEDSVKQAENILKGLDSTTTDN